MRRFTVSEAGQPPLPAVDLDEPLVVIGSGADARIRLPAAVARERHVEVGPRGWRALAEVVVDGVVREAGASGELEASIASEASVGASGVIDEAGGGVVFELGAYRVRVAPAPAGTAASPPRRTESLARELVRGLLGAGAAPTLQIERGPLVGAARALPPPEAELVIGRGDEAGWVILDEDLSRAHAVVRRGWDGVAIRDLGSKNGTRVEGAEVGPAGVELHDGAQIELGNVRLVFRDPAERHLRGAPAAVAQPAAAPAQPPATGATAGAAGAPGTAASARMAGTATAPAPRPAAAAAAAVPGRWVVVVAFAIAGAAVAGLIWILAS